MTGENPQASARPFLSEIVRLKRLWPYIRDQKTLLFVAACLIPFISIIEMNVPLTIKRAIDEGVTASNWDKLSFWAFVYLGLVLAQYFCRAAQGIAAANAVHKMIRSLRITLIRHVLALSPRFHDNSLSGRLVTRATSDFDNLSESLNMGVLTALIDLAVLFGSVIGLFYLSWQLALTALVILPLVSLVVNFFSKSLKKTMLNARVKLAKINGFSQECLYGQTTIKLLTAEKQAQEKFNNLNEDYRKAQMKSVILDASMFSIIDGLASITIGIVLFFAVKYMGQSESITAGLIIAFVQYIQQMFEPIKHLSNKVALLQGAFTSIERIFGVLDEDDIIVGSKRLDSISGKVSFQHVTFSYRKNQQGTKILKDVSFEIVPGQSLAIVGSTGSGKSTIIKLLTKLYAGYEGKILLDNVDLSELDPNFLRKNLAIVPQDIVIFDGSIAFNIGLGQPDISDLNIRAAAEAVGADKFINNLPNNYDYPLKEQGGNLSHGQRQLIAFARALASNPSMIILDEATSSVDPESEALIQKGVDSIIDNRTVIVIAHRLSTIKKCDQILVLDHGEVLEAGSHETLIERKGAYFALQSALSQENGSHIPA